MAELTTLARPYAKAAFQAAREASDLKGWSGSLTVAAAVAQDAKVRQLLGSPTLTAEQKASLFIELCGDTLLAKAKTFISVLAENKRLGLIPAIYEQYEHLKAQQEKFANVQVFSAFSLDSKLEALLADKLKKILACDVSLKTSIDDTLLGGVVIRSGDTVIDGSVKGRLNKLAESLGL
jgi:F-type H+-transporting ATPase subunit delta